MVAAIHLPSTPQSHDARRRWLGTRAYWLCQTAGWGGLLAVWLGPVFLRHTNLANEIVFAVLLCGSGLVLSHLLRVTVLAQLGQPRPWPVLAARLMPWVLGVSVAQVGLLLGFVEAISAGVVFDTPEGAVKVEPGPALLFLDTLTLCLPLFTIWTGFYLGLRYYRQYQLAQADGLRLAALVKEAELGVLKAQLDPHFLFNSLNTIRALVPREGREAREAVTRLSELLRASLTLGRSRTIPLEQELAMVDDFLALEQLRHEGRLSVTRALDPAARELAVPPFLLQLLVENALKHGIAQRVAGGEIRIEAERRGDELILRVGNLGRLADGAVNRDATDDGANDGTKGGSTGLGLKNARGRLVLLFGPTATLTARQVGPERVEVEAVLPAREARSGGGAFPVVLQ